MASGELVGSGGRVNLERLGGLIVGFLGAPVAFGIVETINAVYETFVVAPLETLGGVLSETVATALAIPTAALNAVANSSAAYVEQWGILGFTVAMGLVMTSAYLLAVERDILG